MSGIQSFPVAGATIAPRAPKIPQTLAEINSTNLVARWLLDGTLTDQVSSRALTRAGTWNTNSYNMVWDIELRQYVPVFTGSNYYTFNPAAHSGNAAFPSGAAAGTITGWAKWMTTEPATMMSYGSDAALASRGIQHISGSIRAWRGGGGVDSGISALSDGTWHHCALAYNGSTLSIYVDGVFQSSGTHTINTGLSAGTIGRYFSGNNMVGCVADCRVYSAVLTSAIVEEIATGRA